MKKIFAFLLCGVLSIHCISAQTVTYTAFVYTNDGLAEEIQDYSNQMKVSTRGLGDQLWNATVNAAKGITSGYITSVVDLGVQAVANLITRQERIKQEWEQTVNAENVFCTQIHTITGLTDFYSTPSTSSAIDPTGMKFDGIGVIRKEGDDTLFYISMHIDRSKIDRIVKHSKFELVLDTLILSPTHSNLPNSSFDTIFRWEDRENYAIQLHLTVTSSWMNEITQIFNNEKLGEFTINVPVKKEDLDTNGFLHYVRQGQEQSRYEIVGSSFVVPRSYSGYFDSHGVAHSMWGTGEYQIALDIKETCNVTEAYKKNWKQNREMRIKKAEEGKNVFVSSWQFITSQKWDEITKSWVVTVLQAPANVLSNELVDKMGLKVDTSAIPPKPITTGQKQQ